MNTLMKTSAIVLAVALSGPVLAASAVDMKTCDTLIHEFDTGIKATTAATDKVTAAKLLRASGEKNCKSANYSKGVTDLHAALADLGIKSKVMSTAN